jgi:hypothetical protein
MSDQGLALAFAAAHKTDLIVLGCVGGLAMGVTAGVLYPLPDNSKIKSMRFKCLLSVMGGLSAFVYALSKGAIDEMTMLWVAGVAFAAPAAAEAAHAVIVGAIVGAINGLRGVR